jgi:hypothetical protein
MPKEVGMYDQVRHPVDLLFGMLEKLRNKKFMTLCFRFRGSPNTGGSRKLAGTRTNYIQTKLDKLDLMQMGRKDLRRVSGVTLCRITQ